MLSGILSGIDNETLAALVGLAMSLIAVWAKGRGITLPSLPARVSVVKDVRLVDGALQVDRVEVMG